MFAVHHQEEKSMLANLCFRGWVSCGIASIFVLSTAVADEFAQFRGQDGLGLVANQRIPTNWSSEKNLAWKVPNPGSGWSQPILWEDRMYVTSAFAETDIRPKDFANGVKMPQSMGLGSFAKAPDVEIQWQVTCLDANSGKTLWNQVVAKGKPQYSVHPSNTYATETPVVDRDGIYVFFGATGTVAALDHDGQPKWKKELGVYATSNSFGTGSSLAIYDSKLFVQHFTEGTADLHCFATKDGSVVWKSSREKPATAWSSPILWRNDARVELLVSAGEQVDSFDPKSGSLLWQLSNVKAPTACSMAANQNCIFFGGSDPMSKGPLVAMKAGATGKLAPAKKNGEFEGSAWIQKQAAPGMASPVATKDLVFVIDNNVLRCYDAVSGEKKYQARVPELKMVNACPIMVDDKLLLLDETGNAALIKASSEFEVVGGGKVDDVFWATPAVGNNSIYLRGVDSLYCFRESK